MARERRLEERKEDLRTREQELRAVCQHIAATIPKNTKGVKQAGQLELFVRGPEDRPIPTVAQVARAFPEEEPETL